MQFWNSYTAIKSVFLLIFVPQIVKRSPKYILNGCVIFVSSIVQYYMIFLYYLISCEELLVSHWQSMDYSNFISLLIIHHVIVDLWRNLLIFKWVDFLITSLQYIWCVKWWNFHWDIYQLKNKGGLNNLKCGFLLYTKNK